jgi:radical SAM protein with 4Fe4S-binding SPASM domain
MRYFDLSISTINKLREVMRVYSLRKVYNILMGALQLWLRSSKLYYLPTRISIETGNVCNLRCPLCPTGRREANISRGFMTFEDYARIIDELRKDLILVRLYNWGEPLLNRSIIPMITYARDSGMSVHLSTNLNILDRQTAHDLLEASPMKIFISCDGASTDTYRKYHVGGDFDVVIGNMRLLLEEKKKLPHCHTRIIWLFHVFRHNEHEVDKAVEMAESLGLETRINKMRTDMGKEIFEKARHSIARDIEWIPENPKYCAFDLEKKEVKKKKSFCPLPWKDTVVNWDGAVLPCCSVCEEKYSFGNAFSDRFRNIWNGEAYLAARRELARRRNRQKTVCHICKENEFTHF